MLRNLGSRLSAPWRSRRDQSAVAVKTRRPAGRRSFEPLEPRLVLDAGPFVINEFMPRNDSGLSDQDGEFSDWIEIFNFTAEAESIEGWYLTDDAADRDQWRFPDVTIAGGGYLVVFASAKNRTDPASELHTNFQLAGDGEYLALVRPDGVTIEQEFAPEFPAQAEDVSYGLSQAVSSLVTNEHEVRYQIPTSDDADEPWTTLAFDDSAWPCSSDGEPTVLITEIGTGSPDYIEIQNVSDQEIDTTGWHVVANKGTSGDINQYHTPLELHGTMAPGEVLLWTDKRGTSNYFGEGINWGTGGGGWGMILDGEGSIVDFVPWRYAAEEIDLLNTTISTSTKDFTVRGSSAFSGSGVPTSNMMTLQRRGSSDHDDHTDFEFVSASPANDGLPNADLQLPMTNEKKPGIGFSPASGFGEALRTDLTTTMLDVNASAWTRVLFEVEDPTVMDTLILQMQYNDGFVAYLNGQQIAQRNAPDSPTWGSTARAGRGVEESLREASLTCDLDSAFCRSPVIAPPPGCTNC